MTPHTSSTLSDLSKVDKSRLTETNTVLKDSKTVKVEFSEEIITNEPEVICKCCGRPLKEANSRILGMGPTCYKRFIAERNKQINLLCRKPIGKTESDG